MRLSRNILVGILAVAYGQGSDAGTQPQQQQQQDTSAADAAAADTTVDAGADTTVDAGADTTVDAGADTTVDAGADATVDTAAAASITAKNCPQKCWTFNTASGECEVDSTCFDLKCNFDNMHLTYDPDMFMIDDVNSNPTNTDDKKSALNNGKFELDCALGKCGMELTSKKVTVDAEEADYLIFSYTLMHKYPGKKFQGMDIYMTNPINIEVKFECAYKESIKVESDEFSVHAVDAKGKLMSFGSLDAGFSLKLFQDAAMSKSVVNAADVYIGSRVYAQVSWNVDTLSAMADFFVMSCGIGFDNGGTATSIDVIHNTCFSSTFDAAAVTSPKNQSRMSAFYFKSFIVGGGARTMAFKMTCNIKVCAKGEQKCAAMLVTDDANCGGDAEYAYKA